MNPAYVLAQTLESEGFGTLGVNVHIGVLPADDDANDSAWVVTAQGGQPDGGNNIKHKMRHQVVITYENSDPEAMYAVDFDLRNALSAIPYDNPQFIAVNVGPLQDMYLAEQERRFGQWAVEVVTFNASFEAEEES